MAPTRSIVSNCGAHVAVRTASEAASIFPRRQCVYPAEDKAPDPRRLRLRNDQLTNTLHISSRADELPLARCPRLSPREHEVLLLLADGYTNREIAEKIFRSIKTVETYRANIKRKLGLRKRAEIVRYVRAAGLLNRTA